MYFGAHVSIQPSLEKAPENGAAIGAEVIQIFTQSPRGGTRRKPEEVKVKKFRAAMKRFHIKAVFVHTPYFINLASKNNRIYYGSIAAIRHDLEVASMLGARAVVTHLGSARDFVTEAQKKKKGLAEIPSQVREKVEQGLAKIMDGYTGEAKLALEIAAGAGQIIGSNLEQITDFARQLKTKGGICFDTAHAFESGLAFGDEQEVKKALDQIDERIGLDKLLLMHLNDSKTKMGSHADRHEHLGMGELGVAPFQALVEDRRMAGKYFVVETPTLEGMREDIEFLKGVRAGLKRKKP